MPFRAFLVEFGKALAWLGAAMLWTWVGVHIVSETPLGATVVLAPALLMAAIGIYFYARSRGLFRSEDDNGSDE